MEEQILNLEKRIKILENAQNLNFNYLMFDEIAKNGFIKTSSVNTYGTDLQRSITISATPQTFTVPENPINSAIIKANNGTEYRILLYSLT